MPHQLRAYHDRQRTQLQEYLRVLTAQEEVILHGDIDGLEYSMRLERRMITDLEVLGNVIRPLHEIFPSVSAPDLQHLHQKVSAQHARNRELLSHRIDELSHRIREVHVPRRARSVYREGATGSMLNVTT